MKKIRLSERTGYVLLLLCQLGILAGIGILRSAYLLFHTTGVFYWKVLYTRGLTPVIIVSAATLGLMVFILLKQKSVFSERKRVSYRFIIAAAVFLLLAGILIGKTRLGLKKENAFYGKPTVPLLEWHLLAGFLICAFWTYISAFCSDKLPKKISRLFPLIIWLCAFLIWIGIPNMNGFFSPAGRAPNYETYPFSDGSFYGHYARSLAAGYGFKGDDIPPRPLYIAVLGLLHLLGGNDYDTIIVFQTLIIALLPVFVYLIGKELHSESAGLYAATLVILRETHSILTATFAHNVSTTKYFFADLPTALALSFFMLMMIRWIKNLRSKGNSSAALPLFAGCALGIAALIRTQCMCLLFLILFVIFDGHKSKREKLTRILLFACALGVTVAPWLIRNYRITGKLVFDHPRTQTAEMARSYNFDKEDLSQLEDENDGEYSERMTAFIARSFSKHFDKISEIVTIHFINNELGNLRLFPLRDSLNDPHELIRTETPFWEDLDSGDLSLYNLIFFGLSCLVLIYGIAAAAFWKRKEGLLPLIGILFFNFSTSLGRYSAGRYLIPMDWVVMLYFAIGGAEWCRRLSGSREETKLETRNMSIVGALAVILISAAVIPFAEHIVPNTYEPMPAEDIIAELGEYSGSCDTSNISYYKTTAIYPRYYAAGEGEPESAKQGYGEADFGRLVFVSLAPGHFSTVELRTESIPEYFPDGAEVLLNTCDGGATALAESILVTDPEGNTHLYHADSYREK